jgi:hypothetical protein
MVAPLTFGPGWTVGPGWGIGPRVLLTTTAAQNYAADGPIMNTFRVLNRGGNWDEFLQTGPMALGLVARFQEVKLPI